MRMESRIDVCPVEVRSIRSQQFDNRRTVENDKWKQRLSSQIAVIR